MITLHPFSTIVALIVQALFWDMMKTVMLLFTLRSMLHITMLPVIQ